MNAKGHSPHDVEMHRSPAYPGTIAGVSILVGGDVGLVGGLIAFNTSYGPAAIADQPLMLIATVVPGCVVGAAVGAVIGWIAEKVFQPFGFRPEHRERVA